MYTMPRLPSKPLFVAEEYYALKTRKDKTAYTKSHRRLTNKDLDRENYPVSMFQNYRQKRWILIAPNKPNHQIENVREAFEDKLNYVVEYHKDEMSITYILEFKERIRLAQKFRYFDSQWSYIPHTEYFK